ncbi:MAG: type II toxin-antitoxin system RelE/ParE family toxin [Nitrospirota bacterium]
MAQVSWTEQALDDVAATCEFIARDSFRYAQLFADRVFTAAGRLEISPRLGRVVPEFGRDDIREILLGNYRIVYRVFPHKVEILTVYHGARLLDLTRI